MLQEGEIVDKKYRIVKLLGKGGTGFVYLAENIKVGNNWAIKELDQNKALSRDYLAEVDILRKLNHRNLPRIVDLFEHEGTQFLVEDYFHGITLKNLLSDRKICSEQNAVKWACELCETLMYLHGIEPNPIIYRDMKPGNIIIDDQNNAKLIDLGIAREYKEGQNCDTVYIGTRGYAAPEQYSGSNQTDERTDIYGLGATIYHVVTGYSPNEPPYHIQPIRKVNSYLSAELEQIILKCTNNNPSVRYQRVKDLLFDLNNIRKPRAGSQAIQIKSTGTRPKLVVLGSLSSRAGSSCITANLAASLAAKGLKITVLEPPLNIAYYFDAMFLSDKTQGKFISYCHEIKRGNTLNKDDLYKEYDVEWMILDPTAPFISDWTYTDSTNMILSVKNRDMVLLDLSTNWTDARINQLLNLADHIFLVVDPDPVLLDRTERVEKPGEKLDDYPNEFKTTKLLTDMRDGGFKNISIVLNKYTEGLALDQLYLPFKIASIVPHISPAIAYKSLWDGNLLYHDIEIGKLLERSFSPLIELLTRQESCPVVESDRSGLLDKVKTVYKVILGERKGAP